MVAQLEAAEPGRRGPCLEQLWLLGVPMMTVLKYMYLGCNRVDQGLLG
jgi:hypothetical protein